MKNVRELLHLTEDRDGLVFMDGLDSGSTGQRGAGVVIYFESYQSVTAILKGVSQMNNNYTGVLVRIQ